MSRRVTGLADFVHALALSILRAIRVHCALNTVAANVPVHAYGGLSWTPLTGIKITEIALSLATHRRASLVAIQTIPAPHTGFIPTSKDTEGMILITACMVFDITHDTFASDTLGGSPPTIFVGKTLQARISGGSTQRTVFRAAKIRRRVTNLANVVQAHGRFRSTIVCIAAAQTGETASTLSTERCLTNATSMVHGVTGRTDCIYALPKAYLTTVMVSSTSNALGPIVPCSSLAVRSFWGTSQILNGIAWTTPTVGAEGQRRILAICISSAFVTIRCRPQRSAERYIRLAPHIVVHITPLALTANAFGQ